MSAGRRTETPSERKGPEGEHGKPTPNSTPNQTPNPTPNPTPDPAHDPMPIHAAPDGEIDPLLSRVIVDNLEDGVYFVDPTRRITYWNHGAENITGYESGYVVGHRCHENILNHVDASGRVLCFTACPLAQTILDGKPREALVWLKHHDGHRKPVRMRASQVRDADGKVIGGVEVFHDETEVRDLTEEAERARQEALTDALTSLPNRRFFDSALATRLENMARYGWEFGLLVVDIDHFKAVNDAHGHAFGDEVLKVVAKTLQGAVRAGDIVSRWGGEEFAVLVEAPDVPRLEEAAERLRVLVTRSEVPRAPSPLQVTVSVGATLAGPLDSAESLFNRADDAMRSAKRAGRNRTSIVRLD